MLVVFVPPVALTVEATTNTGASFTSVMVTVAVAAALSRAPSFTMNVKASAPLALAFGT